jgi:threonine/homoserine/homoserine lactone efflux protein
MLAFAVFAAVLTVTPGLDTLLVLRTTAAYGARGGVAAALGISAGCLCWAVASALGVTAVLAASRLAFDVLRVAGAAYLCWLGVRALWHARRPAPAAAPEVDAEAPDPGRRTAWRSLRVGLTTNLLNPKVGVFYLSVLPQFLPRGVNPLLGSLALTSVHLLEGIIWLSLLVVLVGRARHLLVRPSVKRRMEQLTGVVFIGFGVRLAVQRAVA